MKVRYHCTACQTTSGSVTRCPTCGADMPGAKPTHAAMRAADAIQRQLFEHLPKDRNYKTAIARLIDAETRLPELEALKTAVLELRSQDGCWPWCDFKLHDQGVCRCKDDTLTKLLPFPAKLPET